MLRSYSLMPFGGPSVLRSIFTATPQSRGSRQTGLKGACSSRSHGQLGIVFFYLNELFCYAWLNNPFLGCLSNSWTASASANTPANSPRIALVVPKGSWATPCPCWATPGSSFWMSPALGWTRSQRDSYGIPFWPVSRYGLISGYFSFNNVSVHLFQLSTNEDKIIQLLKV